MTEMVLVKYEGDERILVGALSQATYEFAPGDPPKSVHPDDLEHIRGLPGFVVVGEVSEGDSTND